MMGDEISIPGEGVKRRMVNYIGLWQKKEHPQFEGVLFLILR